MPEFRPAAGWGRGGGRTPAKVPPDLVTWLRKSYETGTFFEIPVGPDDLTSANEVIRLARIACRRRQKSLQHELDQEDGVLRLRMRDKRQYRRASSRPETEDVA